jgi:hypothetical protein
MVTELKPWVRVATTLYVFTVIPILLFMFGLMAFNAPRIFATAYDSFFVQWDKVHAAFSGGDTFTGVFGAFQMIVLVLPALGIVVTFWKLAQRIGVGAWTKTEGRPLARAALVTLASAASAFVAYVWWPNGDYKPIQPGEKGTIQGAVRQFSPAALKTGRPALTPAREEQLGGAPTRRARTSPAAPTNEDQTQTATETTQTATTTSTSAATPTTSTTTATSTEPASTSPGATVTVDTTATVTVSTTVATP